MNLTELLGKFEGMDEHELPVDEWHPEHCGVMDLHIDKMGRWFHEGSPIGRDRLVKLFSRILRKDPDGYVLVTPAEKVSIRVEDVPFIVVMAQVVSDASGLPMIEVITNVGDVVSLSEEHPLELRQYDASSGLVPYVKVRGELWARVNRNAFYTLADLAKTDQKGQYGVESHGFWFPLA